MRIAAAAATALIVTGIAAADTTPTPTPYWGQHWRKTTTGPLQLNVHVATNTDQTWAASVQSALDRWNQSTVVHLTLQTPADCANWINGLPMSQRRNHDICISQVYDPSAWWAGLTVPYGDGGGDFGAVSIFVNTYWGTPSVDLFTHELGHSLGLAHGPSNLQATPEDMAELAIIYNHIDQPCAATCPLDTWPNTTPPPPPSMNGMGGHK